VAGVRAAPPANPEVMWQLQPGIQSFFEKT
jgi:hypothetical protein